MIMTLVEVCSLFLFMLGTISSCQRFSLPSTPSRSPGLQVDGAGKIYVSSESQLYRLNSNLKLEETRSLTSEAVNISLSTNGRWLVVCLTDLSCEVYNATNLAVEPVIRRENVIRAPENVALFVAEDSFYVGSISVADGSGAQKQIILGQYGFAGNRNGTAESGTYSITTNEFESRRNIFIPVFVRNFYGGFVRESNAYYFATDNNPSSSNVSSIRVIRVCHNSDFGALYELSLGCGGITPSFDTRISGISVKDNFAGMSGTTIVLSRNQPQSSQNFLCFFNLEMIDNIMQQKFDSCTVAMGNTQEQIHLAWRNTVTSCDDFMVSNLACYAVLM